MTRIVHGATPIATRPARASAAHRAAALGVCLLCASILIVAARLDASPDGHGTHTQLGIPPCGWALALNKPCATCGMTTAFAHAADGHFVAAFLAQPAGLVGAISIACLACAALHVALTGSALARIANQLANRRTLFVAIAIVLASWAYKFATWET